MIPVLEGELGSIRLIQSTLRDNGTCAVYMLKATPDGYQEGGEVLIEQSTIAGNSGVLCGGVNAYILAVLNSTISGNTQTSDCHDASSKVNPRLERFHPAEGAMSRAQGIRACSRILPTR